MPCLLSAHVGHDTVSSHLNPGLHLRAPITTESTQPAAAPAAAADQGTPVKPESYPAAAAAPAAAETPSPASEVHDSQSKVEASAASPPAQSEAQPATTAGKDASQSSSGGSTPTEVVTEVEPEQPPASKQQVADAAAQAEQSTTATEPSIWPDTWPSELRCELLEAVHGWEGTQAALVNSVAAQPWLAHCSLTKKIVQLTVKAVSQRTKFNGKQLFLVRTAAVEQAADDASQDVVERLQATAPLLEAAEAAQAAALEAAVQAKAAAAAAAAATATADKQVEPAPEFGAAQAAFGELAQAVLTAHELEIVAESDVVEFEQGVAAACSLQEVGQVCQHAQSMGLLGSLACTPSTAAMLTTVHTCAGSVMDAMTAVSNIAARLLHLTTVPAELAPRMVQATISAVLRCGEFADSASAVLSESVLPGAIAGALKADALAGKHVQLLPDSMQTHVPALTVLQSVSNTAIAQTFEQPASGAVSTEWLTGEADLSAAVSEEQFTTSAVKSAKQCLQAAGQALRARAAHVKMLHQNQGTADSRAKAEAKVGTQTAAWQRTLLAAKDKAASRAAQRERKQAAAQAKAEKLAAKAEKAADTAAAQAAQQAQRSMMAAFLSSTPEKPAFGGSAASSGRQQVRSATRLTGDALGSSVNLGAAFASARVGARPSILATFLSEVPDSSKLRSYTRQQLNRVRGMLVRVQQWAAAEGLPLRKATRGAMSVLQGNPHAGYEAVLAGARARALPLGTVTITDLVDETSVPDAELKLTSLPDHAGHAQAADAPAAPATFGRRKLLSFAGNPHHYRPPYWGTWPQSIHDVQVEGEDRRLTARWPWGQVAGVDYEYDSGEEWDEDEEGEDIASGSEGDAESDEEEDAQAKRGADGLDYGDGWLCENNVIDYDSDADGGDDLPAYVPSMQDSNPFVQRVFAGRSKTGAAGVGGAGGATAFFIGSMFDLDAEADEEDSKRKLFLDGLRVAWTPAGQQAAAPGGQLPLPNFDPQLSSASREATTAGDPAAAAASPDAPGSAAKPAKPTSASKRLTEIPSEWVHHLLLAAHGYMGSLPKLAADWLAEVKPRSAQMQLVTKKLVLKTLQESVSRAHSRAPCIANSEAWEAAGLNLPVPPLQVEEPTPAAGSKKAPAAAAAASMRAPATPPRASTQSPARSAAKTPGSAGSKRVRSPAPTPGSTKQAKLSDLMSPR